jgi:GntR family transcriptional regulator, transcriptional repressor for pyruvate dehydrogenase complex
VPVGERIETERALCERFGVSRSVVREALSELKSDGVVIARQGSGLFVADDRKRQSFRLRPVPLSEKKALAPVLELLVTFEGGATRLAALRRTAADLQRIHRALMGMEYAIAQDQLGDEEDYAFHKSIVDATHNPHFRAMNEYLEHSVRRLMRQSRTNTAARFRNLVRSVQLEHQAIYDAIEARDASAAAAASETHLRNAAKRLGLYLSQ